MNIKKLLKGLLIGILVPVIVIYIGGFAYATVKYRDYFRQAEAKFVTPGLWDDWVPQGFHLLEEENLFLFSGYMGDDTASRVYVRDGEGKTHYSMLYYADGTAYTKHAGGVCANGEYVYVAGDTGVDVFDLSDILAGRDARMLGTLETGYDMAFCTFYDGYLLTGNFYYPEHYETPWEHRIITPAGDHNTALITVFAAEPNGEFGMDPTPVAAFSTPDRVQGMCITPEGELILSISWSVNDSKLLYYQLDLTREDTITVRDTQVPLFFLDSQNLSGSVTLPPMAEELIFRDGKVWVVFESACQKYFFGNLIRGRHVYAYGK